MWEKVYNIFLLYSFHFFILFPLITPWLGIHCISNHYILKFSYLLKNIIGFFFDQTTLFCNFKVDGAWWFRCESYKMVYMLVFGWFHDTHSSILLIYTKIMIIIECNFNLYLSYSHLFYAHSAKYFCIRSNKHIL